MRDINALISKNKNITKSATASSSKASNTGEQLNQTVNQSKSKRVGLSDIQKAAQAKFGNRKPRKQQQRKPKQQPRQAFEAKSKHEKLNSWKKAMDQTHVPVAKVQELYRRIDKLSGTALQMVEKELFTAEQFDMVYNWKSDDNTLIEEYIDDLEDAISKAENSSDNILDITDVMDIMDKAMNGDNTALVAASVIAPVALGYIKNDYVASYIDQEALTEDVKQAMESKFATIKAKDISMSNSDGIITIKETIGKNVVQTNVSTSEIKQKYGIDLNTSEGQSAFDDIIQNELQDVYKTHVQDPGNKVLDENIKKQRQAQMDQMKEFIENQTNKNDKK